MFKGKGTLLVAIVAIVVVALLACSSPAPSPTSPPAPVASTSAAKPAPPPTSAAAPSQAPAQTSVVPVSPKAPTGTVYKGRIAVYQVQTDIRAVWVANFIDRVKQKTGGQVDLTGYYSGTLFGINDIVPAVGKGAVDGGFAVGAPLSGFIPEYNLESLWFITTPDTMHQAWNSPAGKAVMAKVESQLNCKYVTRYTLGASYILSTKPIKKLEDFKGLKARAITAADAPFSAALGMSSVTVATEEIYTALQSGMIEMIGSAIENIRAMAWWDKIKYVLKPSYGSKTGIIMFNADWWKKLPANLQQQIIEVGQAIEPEAYAAIPKQDEVVEAEFIKSHGGTVNTLSKDEMLRIVQAIKDKGAYDGVQKQMGPDFWDTTLKICGVTLK